MPIREDHSELPRSGQQRDDHAPDDHPRFAVRLAHAWADRHVDESDRPFAIEGSKVRGSWAGKCVRDLGYRIAGLEETDPPDLAGYWRMSLGQILHEQIQEVLSEAFPMASIEHVVSFLDGAGSGHADVFLALGDNGVNYDTKYLAPDHPARRILIEVKSINGFGFKRAVGARGSAEGPRDNALAQAALYGKALDAHEIVIVYLSLECLSDRELVKLMGTDAGESWRKFAAEWTYERDEFLPIAQRHETILAKAIEMAGDDEHPLLPRHVPDQMPNGAVVVDPTKGLWELKQDGQILDAGETWLCNYCGNRSRCIADGE